MNIRFPTDNITDASFVVQWDAVNNHIDGSYIITWSIGTNPIQTATVNHVSYTVIGLSPNTTYTVTVAVVNKYNCTGPASTDRQVTTNLTDHISGNISPTYAIGKKSIKKNKIV